MASKVMVKIPVAPFGQVNKSKPGGVNTDLVAVTRTPDPPSIRSAEIQKSSESVRIAQLEQNIRFLQEQHQLMLNGLHHEIDSLRHRNRGEFCVYCSRRNGLFPSFPNGVRMRIVCTKAKVDKTEKDKELQFQLVFAKTSLPSTPSSPEDDTKPKVNISPKQVNVTPLQVEILEREMSDLKIQLQETESRNVYLSAIVDEQKKKLERYERERERERERGIQPDPELLRKLDDAEALIRRLRRENSDLRRESSASPTGYTNRESGSYHSRDGATQHQSQKNSNQNRGNSRHRGNGGGHYRNWFPPLHSQNYWQNIRSLDKNGTIAGDGSQLPNLQTSGGSSVNPTSQQGRRGGNNNHYHNNESRKFRGGQNRGNKPS